MRYHILYDAEAGRWYVRCSCGYRSPLCYLFAWASTLADHHRSLHRLGMVTS